MKYRNKQTGDLVEVYKLDDGWYWVDNKKDGVGEYLAFKSKDFQGQFEPVEIKYKLDADGYWVNNIRADVDKFLGDKEQIQEEIDSEWCPNPVCEARYDTSDGCHSCGYMAGKAIQKSLDDSIANQNEERYAKQVDAEMGTAIGDIFRKQANPEFRYLFFKEEQQLNGEILAAKLAKQEKLAKSTSELPQTFSAEVHITEKGKSRNTGGIKMSIEQVYELGVRDGE